MTAPAEPWTLGYRPGLDGLRGIAVALVLWNHGGFPIVGAAGAVGVNIFFVLSGFLITRLALEERERTGTMSLKRFYWRRSLRLFPAMYTVLAVTTVVALATDRSLVPIVYAATYLLNFVKTAGMDVHLVTHMWTLSMEEQFYLVWPAALLCALRCGHRRRAIMAVSIGMAVSLAVRIGAGTADAGLVYLHNSPALATGVLLAGCLLALIAERVPGTLLVKQGTFVVGCFVVALASFGVKTTGLYVIGIPAVTIASVVIIAYLAQDEQAAWIARVFSWGPLQYVGRISYGLYLWHFIVFWFVRQNVDFHPYARWVLQVAASLAIATISYRLVERPFLRLKDRFRGELTPELAAVAPSGLPRMP
jgi:peptidoglycan/LPS O-acetylase OafA/YrhL